MGHPRFVVGQHKNATFHGKGAPPARLKTNDDTLIHKSSGDVLWIPAGRAWPLTNIAGTRARFTVVDLWKATN